MPAQAFALASRLVIPKMWFWSQFPKTLFTAFQKHSDYEHKCARTDLGRIYAVTVSKHEKLLMNLELSYHRTAGVAVLTYIRN